MKHIPVLAVLALSAAHASWADTLPAASVEQYLQYPFLQQQTTTIVGPSSLVASEGSVANFNNSYTPNPSVTATLSTSANLGNGQADTAASDIFYSFEVVDSQSSAASPVNLSVNYTWGGSSNGSTKQQFDASMVMVILNPTDGTSPLLLQPCLSNYAPQCTAGQSFSTSGSATASVLTNTVYSFDIGAGATAYGPQQTVTAYLDPYLALAQGNPNLQIEVSAGVGNVGAVPEPSTTLLLLAGLSAVGLRQLRQRKAS